MITDIRHKRHTVEKPAHAATCEHRAVAPDGRIVCSKITEGDAEVSPNICRDCPFKAVDCSHLRFSLRLISPSPLVVRFNGHEEVWDNGPPRLQFERAACAERVVPIHDVRVCAECALHQPVQTVPDRAMREPAAAGRASGAVIPFPSREAVAAAAG
ncbi:MAG: hypothetical protein JXA93_18885 [Anaerolineae bacterium]|nr:hypothetical protein [Anaerolineae bacterium]